MIVKSDSGPLVSVIIPVYNGERYLAEAIESVLAQSYSPLEIILVNDGSTDASAGIGQKYHGVRYCYQDNQGHGAARNRGVRMARGEFLSFLDHDDVWLEDKLERQVDVFSRLGPIDLVFGMVQEFLSPGIETDRQTELSIKEGYVAGTMLITREAFFSVGLFDARWRVGEFIDWYARAREKGCRHYLIPQVLMRRRVHDSNLTRRENKNRIDYVRIARAALERRREKS